MNLTCNLTSTRTKSYSHHFQFSVNKIAFIVSLWIMFFFSYSSSTRSAPGSGSHRWEKPWCQSYRHSSSHWGQPDCLLLVDRRQPAGKGYATTLCINYCIIDLFYLLGAATQAAKKTLTYYHPIKLLQIYQKLHMPTFKRHRRGMFLVS